MKQKMLCSMLVLVMLFVVAPVFSAEVVHIMECEMDDEASEQAIRDHYSEWLKAAKQVKGGENLEGHVLFPVAVTNTGEIDLIILMFAPSFEEWGRFWDNYEGSAAADVESSDDDMMGCPDSTLWDSTKIIVE